jgi:lipoprotein-releasing system permease protein
VRVGQYIQVSAGRQTQRPFKVVGVTHFGNEQVDRSMAFAGLERVQSLARTPGRVSQIAVALYDIDLATKKADQWRIFSNDKVQDWQEANKMFMEMIRVQDYTRYFITSAILIVAAFGIYNVLTIMINQKRKEIAILRALGFGPNDILELILYQGLLLGGTGGLLGLILGFLACFTIANITLDIEIGGSHSLLVSYDWTIYAYAFLAANVAAMIASYLPALAASKMTPIEIIRQE